MQFINGEPSTLAMCYDDSMLSALTKMYEFRCSNYAVAYMFHQFLKKLTMADYTDIMDDYILYKGFPESRWVIFFQCRPQDEERLECVARRIPSSINADIEFTKQEEEK